MLEKKRKQSNLTLSWQY